MTASFACFGFHPDDTRGSQEEFYMKTGDHEEKGLGNEAICTGVNSADKVCPKKLTASISVRIIHYTICIAFLAFLLADLSAFVHLCLFIHPVHDDYHYAFWVLDMGFFRSQLGWYTDWTGRYSATGIMSAYPFAGNFVTSCRVLSLTIMAAFATAFWPLLRATFGRLLSHFMALMLSLTFFAIYAATLPAPNHAFHYLASAVTYTLGSITGLFSIGLFSLALKVKTASRQRWLMWISYFLAAITVGTNEIVAVVFLAMTSFMCLRSWLRGAQNARTWARLVLVVFVFFCVSAAAPGNYYRRSLSPVNSGTTLRYMSAAFVDWSQSYYRWVTNLTVLSGAFALLATVAHFSHRSSCIGRVRAKQALTFLALWLFVGYLSFLPSYLAQGMASPPWAMNVIYFVFLAGWFASAVITGDCFREKFVNARRLTGIISLFALVCLCLSLSGMTKTNNLQEAREDLMGPAQAYDAEMTAREEFLKACATNGVSSCKLTFINARPKILFVHDIGCDPRHPANLGLRKYFKIPQVTCKHGVTPPLQGQHRP
jgi:hypothetical protein